LLEPVKFTKDSILLKPQFGFDNQLHSPLSELSKESTSEEEIGYDAGYEMSIEETYQQIIRELGFIK
jgi:hypothetical protein